MTEVYSIAKNGDLIPLDMSVWPGIADVLTNKEKADSVADWDLARPYESEAPGEHPFYTPVDISSCGTGPRASNAVHCVEVWENDLERLIIMPIVEGTSGPSFAIHCADINDYLLAEMKYISPRANRQLAHTHTREVSRIGNLLETMAVEHGARPYTRESGHLTQDGRHQAAVDRDWASRHQENARKGKERARDAKHQAIAAGLPEKEHVAKEQWCMQEIDHAQAKIRRCTEELREIGYE